LHSKQKDAIELAPLQSPFPGPALLPKLIQQRRMHRNRSCRSLRAIRIFHGLDGRCVHDSTIRQKIPARNLCTLVPSL
jgi:hypothetical protein